MQVEPTLLLLKTLHEVDVSNCIELDLLRFS